MQWLTELLTDPGLATVVYDPGRLLYRTTLDKLEGYCKGSIRQLMLNLTPDQQQYVNEPRPGLTVLKGVAGSGKTTVGVYRAINRAMEGRRVALLTFNRTLAGVTRTLVESLIGPTPDNLTITNIDRWIAEFLAERDLDTRPILDERDSLPLIEGAVAEVKATGRPEAVLEQRPEFFRDEIARVIKGAGIRDLKTYQAALRHGRKTALGPAQREAVWLVYQAYERSLASRSAWDWRDPALKAYEELSQRRTFVLRRNHRNTRQIAEAAAALQAHNQMLKSNPDFIAPEWTQRNGPWPIIVECDVIDRELRAVRERLLDLVADQRFRVSDFAVICPDNDLCLRVRNDLLQAGLPAALHRDEEFNVLEEQVKVLTIHAAKGLEFPVVFLVGVREGSLPRRPTLRLESEERQLELERQRTLLYVGMTRAAEALFLVTTANARSAFLNELGNTAHTELFVRKGSA
ncbi:MAG TPA: 3'-5' exonuclease [Symbiobacteriaceae bacterium]|nr:3'-5' exonuclease [Symbiobacteriaceae bacterium]